MSERPGRREIASQVEELCRKSRSRRAAAHVRMGQKGPSEHVRSMSALPPKADIRTRPRSFGPLGRTADETGHRPAGAECCREAGENCRVTTFVFSPRSMLKCHRVEAFWPAANMSGPSRKGDR